MPSLFEPFTAGDLHLANRIVMAPLTRNRSPNAVPTPLAVTYYAQRASAGLLITEATAISHQGQGYADVPGLYTPEQLASWKRVTDAVHAAGGCIVSQIWHVGRVSHTSLQPGGGAPVAPSALTATTKTYVIENGTGSFVPTSAPRALREDKLPGIVDDYRRAAKAAVAEAGFDAVEIHGANGFLLDQFLQDGSNRRTDAYGGTIENRARLLLEVVDGIAADIGADRTAVRLSPHGNLGGLSDSDTVPHFGTVIRELGKRGLAYLHLIEPRASSAGIADNASVDSADNAVLFRHLFDGPVITAGGYTSETGAATIRAGLADGVAFGRMFIANPDLPERIRTGAALNDFDRATAYGGDARGYIDYPALGAETRAA